MLGDPKELVAMIAQRIGTSVARQRENMATTIETETGIVAGTGSEMIIKAIFETVLDLLAQDDLLTIVLAIHLTELQSHQSGDFLQNLKERVTKALVEAIRNLAQQRRGPSVQNANREMNKAGALGISCQPYFCDTYVSFHSSWVNRFNF